MATQVEILMRTEGKPDANGQPPDEPEDDNGDKQLTLLESARKQFAAFKKSMQGDFKGVTKWLGKNLGLQFNLSTITKQSQVFTNFVGTIYQLMGALVDVILAPFLPLLFPFIRMMAGWIPTIQAWAQGVGNCLITPL